MRHAQRIALVVTLLFAGLPAGIARADWQTDRAQLIAAKVWNDPCGGRVTLWFTTPQDPSWRAWAYPMLCTIGMSTAKPWKWGELCPVLMHEYGHLAGYKDPANTADPDHSDDPNDIMWPYVHADARCNDYGSALLALPRPPEAPLPVKAQGSVGRSLATAVHGAARARKVRKSRRARRAAAAATATGSAGRSRA